MYTIQDQTDNFFLCPPSEMFFLPDDNMVKHPSRNFTTLPDVLIPAIPHSGNNPNFVRRINIAQELFYGQIAIGIMGKVDHDLEIAELKYVEATRCLSCTWNKCLKGQTEVFRIES